MASHLDYDTAKRIMYITSAPVGGALALDVRRDIYSAVKLDWLNDATLNKFKFPFRTSGGDTVIPGTQYIGNYVFLMYGWTMRPYEADHALYLVNGYLLVDGGGDPWLKTLGGYTVNVRDTVPADAIVLETGVSGVTEQDKKDIALDVWQEDVAPIIIPNSAATALKAGTYEGAISLDTVNGVAGTGWPIGTHYKPSNNLADALTIMGYGNVHRLVLHSNITIGATDVVDGYAIETEGLMGIEVTLTDGCSANAAVFRNVNLQGTLTAGDVILIYDCSILNLDNFSGIMSNVAFGDGAQVSFSNWATIIQGTAGGEPTNEVEFSLNAAALNISHWTGPLKLMNKTGSGRTVLNCSSGNIVIDSSCVAGRIQLLGVGYLDRDSSGPGCAVDTDAFITNLAMAKHVWEHNDGAFVKNIESGRWKIENNQMIFYKPDNNIEVARFNLFDAQGQPAMENVYERQRVPVTTTSTSTTESTTSTTTS